MAVLNASKCDIWVSPKGQNEMLPQLLSHRPMKVIEIPETDELLSTEPVPDYPYNKTFQEAASDPSCVLHTSGSTGLPKPIVWEIPFSARWMPRAICQAVMGALLGLSSSTKAIGSTQHFPFIM